jgi:hypothetical protein
MHSDIFESVYDRLREEGQAKLDAEGLPEVKLEFVREADRRLKATLAGGTPIARSKARKLLPFSERDCL